MVESSGLLFLGPQLIFFHQLNWTFNITEPNSTRCLGGLLCRKVSSNIDLTWLDLTWVELKWKMEVKIPKKCLQGSLLLGARKLTKKKTKLQCHFLRHPIFRLSFSFCFIRVNKCKIKTLGWSKKAFCRHRQSRFRCFFVAWRSLSQSKCWLPPAGLWLHHVDWA